MMKTIMRFTRIYIPQKHFFLIGMFVLFPLISCSSDKDTDPHRLLHGIPEDMIEHITADDDSAFARYGRDAGFVVLSDANKILNFRIYDLYVAGRVEEAMALLPYAKRIAGVLASEYNYGLYLNDLIFLENLSPEVLSELLKHQQEFYAFREQIHLPPSQKLKTYLRLLDTFKKLQDVEYTALVQYEISYAFQALGKEKEQIHYLREACSNFAKCGLHEMTAPVLAELGGYHEANGRIDSMVYYYERAGQLARRSRLPLESAQIAARYSEHYAGQGRLSLAYEMLVEAMETCREFKGEYEELRFIIKTMNFQADLNCWEIVERLLRRARILQSKYIDDPEKYFELYSLQIDRLAGRLHMAAGDVEEAERFYVRTKEALEHLKMPYTKEPETAMLYLYWSQGLLDMGLAGEALRIIREGYRPARESQLAELAARFALLEAFALYRLGETTAAERALERFDSAAVDPGGLLQCELIKRDALAGKLALADGDRERAKNALESGLIRMKRFVSNSDPGVQSYLKIGECAGLHRLMHDMTSHDPAAGYGAELLWRDIYRLYGRPNSRADYFHSVHERLSMSAFRAMGEDARHRIDRIEAVHVMYAILGDVIRRWTVTGEAILCDTLDVSCRETRILVNETWNLLAPIQKESDTVSPARLAKILRKLAHLLLPPHIMQPADATAKQLILITAGDILDRIPFEALDVGNGRDYTPLLMKHDVAYLRHVTPAGGKASENPGVILVSDKLSQAQRKRFPFVQPLPQAPIEAEILAALEPKARLLAGPSASKAELRSLWEDAPFIYFITHTLRDPQVPYLMLIPVAVPENSAAPDAAYVDFSDIRTADFRRCRLVVLSGCSSGAPYVNERISAPAMGDAFLDAGAAAVIQTFWDVRDEDARKLMSLFVPAWQSGESSAVAALCEARRTIIRRSGGIRDIYRWAAYFITSAGL
jgi:CHAT domain-containing protein